MKIERMLAGQGDGTVLRKHSLEEASLVQGSEHRGKMWNPMTRGVSGGSQIRARRSREGKDPDVRGCTPEAGVYK